MSTNAEHVFVVGNSMRGIPVVMQLDFSNKITFVNNWGIIPAGYCDEYSWTVGKKKFQQGESYIEHWATRFYGCTWAPRGRIATGAIMVDGLLFIAAKRDRCTVCVETEQEFDNKLEEFCIEEFEEYRTPASVCGQHSHNQRPFVRERMLEVSQLQRESNSLAGGENVTIIKFQLGKIPTRGEMHAVVVPSHSGRHAIPSWWVTSLPFLWAAWQGSIGGHAGRPLGFASLAALACLISSLTFPMAQAATLAFHQHENDCNCLLGCEILGDDSGTCTDNNRQNTLAFEAALAKVGDDDDSQCRLLQCIAYCAGPQTHDTQMFTRNEELLCASLAKEMNCQMDCSGTTRLRISWALLFLLLFFLCQSLKRDPAQ
eukprot:gnl/TRDRNA2_/TRDRNA2_145111_c1_seq1.p1 gnl/TRDRNA2_/TRDRNA2_145111_c1~~gnl/TRDRNA2_/TRDRNA2_145111_c1_seq1.p1  ORF type:complete len:389 (-),score=47.94 gnl/TRDRNA2_/TRDRNA2_145111_c1_seq1:98-1213(-)